MKRILVILISLMLMFSLTLSTAGMVYAEGSAEAQISADAAESSMEAQINADDPPSDPPDDPEPPEDVSIDGATVALSNTVYKYTGNKNKPTVTSVTLEDGTVVEASNYKVTYADNKASGTATVTVTAKEGTGYTGAATATFTIIGKMTTPELSSKTSRKVTLNWAEYTKSKIDGYMVYKYDKTAGTSTLIKTLKGSSNTSLTIKNLLPGKEYRYKVAAYKKDTVTGEKVAGPLSSYLYVKTNKESIKSAKITLSYSVAAYNGKERRPKVKSVILKNGSTLPSSAYTVSYTNNIQSGWAKVTVTPTKDSGYTDSKSASFYIIAKMDAPKAKKRTKNAITLSWKKHPGTKVAGYYVYKKNDSGKYVQIANVEGVKNTTYTVKGLSSKSIYKFKVAAYAEDKVTGKTVTGKKSDYSSLKTLPSTPSKETLKLTVKKPFIKVKWSKRSKKNATSFEIKYSTSSTFENAQTVTVKNDGEVNSYLLSGLTNNTRYYVKVRAINTYGGYTAYGKWSDKDSEVADVSGWCTIDGRKYYYRYGAPVKGSQIINGEHYYFDSSTGECHGATSVVWEKVQATPVESKYLVTICVSRHRINVFENMDGDWVMIYQWSCTTGLNDKVTEAKQYTPRGNFHVRYKTYTFGDTYSVWYCTNFAGPYFIHSILYEHGSQTVVQDGRLGINASHGCVRTSLSHAKWIYENVSKGSPVISTMD